MNAVLLLDDELLKNIFSSDLLYTVYFVLSLFVAVVVVCASYADFKHQKREEKVTDSENRTLQSDDSVELKNSVHEKFVPAFPGGASSFGKKQTNRRSFLRGKTQGQLDWKQALYHKYDVSTTSKYSKFSVINQFEKEDIAEESGKIDAAKETSFSQYVRIYESERRITLNDSNSLYKPLQHQDLTKNNLERIEA